ncbi:hypothetical protein AAFF_G00037470 [Aldrovandia affinis]|uniref:Uncharacterized protein n=1 Tax=Aldrovandia affinis TaxID=143900 RepID=A0AAD7T512_9TELE|nr:hypothetical protein AAFF_G00037470 [Aldrovandia affinis]
MARPQTDGGVDSRGQGGQQSCRMEALRPDGVRQDAWHRGGVHTLQTGYPLCHGRHDIATTTAYSAAVHSSRSAPTIMPPSELADTPVPESTGTEREQATSVERPCDLLPQRQRPLGEPAGSGGENAELEDEVSGRVADQLRVIGDEMNTMFLQRRNAAQQLQDWRGLCWGLFTLITDTLSTLYLWRHR